MSEMAVGAALLGPPEPDGAVPFVVAGLPVDGQVTVAAGLMVGGQGLRDVDGSVVDVAAAEQIFLRSAGHHGLAAVPLHVALAFGDRVLREGGARPPAPWTALWATVPDGTRATATMTDPLRRLDQTLVASFLARTEPWVEPDGHVIFGLTQSRLSEVIPPLLDALQQDTTDVDRQRAVVDAVADLSRQALDDDARAAWILGMDVLSVIHDSGDAHRSARHTALAMREGMTGDQIPFVRIWVERALRSTMELALQLRGPRPLAERLAARGIDTPQ